jgi:DNA-binding SARP family transcriptional activator
VNRKSTKKTEVDEKIAVSAFGGLSIMYNGSPVTIVWESQKARLLFCYLLVTYDQWVHRDKLIELLWPGCEVAAGANNFKTTISRLRKSFAGPHAMNPVVTQGEAVRLNIGSITLDASEFRHKALNGIKLLARGDLKSARSFLEAAQDCYSGAFLPEEPFNKFITAARLEFANLHASVLNSLEMIYNQEGNNHASEVINFLKKSCLAELA